MRHLVVISPFAHYQVGDHITDADSVAAYLGGPQAAFVTPIAAPDPGPAPEPEAAPEPAPAPASKS
ncbi:hypothetical protein [uncultured Alsobacter sp.]|uniref:hypothetical protein n=1 Tax=uncultured Alsobacter sp. TaxID=1748258 RepID=UPI0025FEF249|nr:hypothetical protein [uncultured Alsobacter sp.]